MKLNFILLACIGAFFAAALAGCISAPKLHLPATSTSSPAAGVKSVATPAPASTVKELVHGQAVTLGVIGGLLLLGSGVLFYFQMYIPAVKVLIAGIALPVVGIIWSAYYGWIIAGSLVGLAIWYMLTHQAAVSAIVKEAGPGVDTILSEIRSLAEKAANKPVQAVAAPVQATTQPQKNP